MTLLRRSLLRDIRGRRAQFAAIGATMLLGVALFAASFDAFQNLNASYRGLYDQLAFADLVAVGGDPAVVSSHLQGEPSVAAVATRSVADLPLSVAEHRFLGRVVELPASGEPAVDRVTVLRGSGLAPAREDGVLVEQHMADHFDLQPGDTIEVAAASGWRTATVLGVVASAEYLWPARSRQEILVPPGEFGVVFAGPVFVSSLPAASRQPETLVRLQPDAPAGAFDSLARLAIVAGASSTYTQAEQPSNAALQEDVSGFGELSLAFPLLFLGAGALAMSVLLGRMVATHRGQIGVLRANGVRRRTLLWHYLAFGLLIGIVGSVPGAILGALAAAAITGVYTGVLAIPTAVVEVRPLTLIIGVVIGPIAGAAAAFGPARRAASTSPAEAMRGDAPGGRGSLSLLERLLPPLRGLPTRWRLALRGLGRNRRRSLSTILGVALATSLIFVSWAMIDTVEVLLDRQFVQIDRSDARVVLAQPVLADTVTEVVDAEGVAAVEPTLELPAAIVGDSRRYGTALVGLVPGTTMRSLLTRDGDVLSPADGEVVLGVALENLLGVGVGDAVAIAPVAGTGDQGLAEPVRLRIAGFVDEPLGTQAYTTLATVARAAGLPGSDPPVQAALVRFEPGADAVAVRDRLAESPSVVAVVNTQALYDIAQQFLGLFYAFVGVMLVLGGIMAFALIFNTLSANVMERAVELTALRALGMPASTIGRIVTTENVLLTVIALLPGLVVAYVLAAVFMASFSSDLFQFELAVRPTTFLGTAVAIVVVALLSQLPSLRTVRRLDLAKVVRERAT
ncbi:MAG: FtsX-like permease family protein [Chloroflexi bacterium]|nr:FtsX-like permease family protein [Chloroflexota bacterium]